MESIYPNFFGLPHKLNQVLLALDLHQLDPVWTLKETKGKIYLDIVWSKLPLESPAIDANNGPSATQLPIHNGPAEVGQGGSEETKPTSPSPTVPMNREIIGAGKNRKKKKRKSPSVLKRDKERQRKWRESKQKAMSSSSCQPTADFAEQLDHKEKPTQTNNDYPPSDNQEYLNYLEAEIAQQDLGQEVYRNPVEIHLPVPPSEQLPQEDPSEDSDRDSEFEELYKRIDAEAEDEYDSDKDINRCFNLKCLRPETSIPGGLKRCTGCKIAVYCTRECQAKHWNIHRSACGKNLI